MRRDNRGISLIEIVIVVAIIGVLMGVGIIAVSSILGRPAQECAEKVAYSLERHRTVATSKIYSSYTLYKSNGDLYLKEIGSNTAGSAGTTVKLGNTVSVKCMLTDGSSVTLADGGSGIELGYDRSSGRFKEIGDEGCGVYCDTIIISRAGRVCEVHLVPLTGKVFLN